MLKADTKITAYDVAANYMEKLQKRYCGTSLHTLQLISAAIAVFGSATLREICELVLFTGISYDVVGVLNDILPLLTVKESPERTGMNLRMKRMGSIYSKVFRKLLKKQYADTGSVWSAGFRRQTGEKMIMENSGEST